MLVGHAENKKYFGESDGFIKVDVTKKYSQKELILQDFMDVEYVVLEATDEFVNQGNVMSIGKEYITVRNDLNDGNIYIYDRNGKAFRVINRKGLGSEEYTFISLIIIDEDKDEMFVYDHRIKKILVYDLYGKFKRFLLCKENVMYLEIFEYDKDNLICCNETATSLYGTNNVESFYIISKQDGSIVKEMEVSYKQKTTSPTANISNEPVTILRKFPIAPLNGDFIVSLFSSDTIFRYLPDHSMKPFIIRTPSVQSMNPEVFLFLGILTENYYFMSIVKKDPKAQGGLNMRDIMYDKQKKVFYENYTIYNNDFRGRTEDLYKRTRSDEVAYWNKNEAFELIEANKQGKLKGKLKEIADRLDEDANPVIMLVKHKK